MLGISLSIFERWMTRAVATGPSSPPLVTISAIQTPASSLLFVGQSLNQTQHWSAFVDPANYATDAPGAMIDSVVVDYLGGAAHASDPFADGELNHFTIHVHDTAGNGRSFNSVARTVTHVPPAIGTIPSLTATQGSGPHVIDLAAAFIGEGLQFTVTKSWASVAGTVLQIADVARTDVLTVKATNSGGSVEIALNISIIATVAPGEIATALFGINTAAGAGATRVSAADGTYHNGALVVSNGMLTKAAGATLSVANTTVGTTAVALVAGKTCANVAEFQNFLAETTNATPLLAYPRVIIAGDVVGMAGYGWNNRLKNLPEGFEFVGAYGNIPSLLPVLDTFVIQTGGIVATAPQITGLKFRHIHFYKEQNLALADRFAVPKEYLLLNYTKVSGLEVRECRFSSDQRSAIEGGRYITQMNGILLGQNAIDTTIDGCTFDNLTYGLTISGSGVMLTHNTMSNMWADWMIAQGGADRVFAMWNHFDTPAGDGTYVHGDMFQIQTQANADDVDGVYLIGNTFTPGNYQDKAYSQAEAKYEVNAKLVFSTNKSITIQDTHHTLLSPADQGFKITLANTTSDRILTLPDAASNAGFTTVLRATGSGRLVFGLSGNDTIEGGLLALNGVTKDQIGLFSDGTSIWKRLPDGMAQNNVLRGNGHTLNLLDHAMLTMVDASLGHCTINLPDQTTTSSRFLVKKSDASGHWVQIKAAAGQTILDIETGAAGQTSRTLSHPGSATLFMREPGETVWRVEDATITLQGVFANPHSNPNSAIRNIWTIANVMMPLSTNGLALIDVASDSYYFHNTLARFIPEEISGDGFVGRAEGWVNGPAGTITLRDNMASAYNFTAGSINVGRESTDVRAFENYTMDSGSGALISTEQVLARQITLLGGTSEAAFRPKTRNETIAALEVVDPGIAHIGAHAVTDFDAELLTLPSLAPREVFPVQNAAAVPLDSILRLRLNFPVVIDATKFVLRNVTDNAVVAITVTTDRTDIVIAPAAQLQHGKQYRVEIGQDGVFNMFAAFDDPTFGPLPITPTAPLAPLNGSDWTFVADQTAFANALTTYAPTGEQVNANLLNKTGVILTAGTRIDNNFDPTYTTNDLPAAFIIRSRVKGTSGTARQRLFAVGAPGSQTVTVDMVTGVVTSDDPSKVKDLDFGANLVAGGYEIWIKGTGTNLSRYYLELAFSGSTPGLIWSEAVLIPANLPQAPFVAPLSPWN